MPIGSPELGAEPGTIYIPQQEGVEARLAAIADKFPVDIHAATAAPAGDALLVRLPRIALYQSWVPSMDEGWTRWIFDQNNIPYTRVVDADIRKGNLNEKFDVVLIPDNSARAITTGRGGRAKVLQRPLQQPKSRASPSRLRRAKTRAGPKQIPEYAGGLGEDGLTSLKAFTENGGTIITLNKASQVYTSESSEVSDALATVNRKEFFIPGSILEVSVDPTNPIAFGSTASVPIFYENGPDV